MSRIFLVLFLASLCNGATLFENRDMLVELYDFKEYLRAEKPKIKNPMAYLREMRNWNKSHPNGGYVTINHKRGRGASAVVRLFDSAQGIDTRKLFLEGKTTIEAKEPVKMLYIWYEGQEILIERK